MIGFWDNFFVLIMVVMSLVMRRIFGAQNRFVWTPIAFGFYLAGECGMIRLAGNWYLYELLRLLITIAKAYLLSGFILAPWKRNPILPWFFAFWCYFHFAVIFGEDPLGAFYSYLKVFEIIAIGYYAGIWAISTPNGVHRLLLWGGIAGGVVAFCWIFTGGLLSTSAMNFAEGRAGVDLDKFDEDVANASFNVNGIGLMLSAVVIYPFLFIFQKAKLWMRLAAMGVAFVLSVLIIRTGARNSALVLVPMAWYLLCAKTALSFGKKILIIILLLGSMFGYLAHMEKDVGQVRAFDIFEGEGDNMGSGRMKMFRIWTQEMGNRKLLGAGAHYDKYGSRRLRITNLHSMYMQIFYQSGILGMTLLVLFVLAFTYKCFTSRQNPYRYMALALLGVWIMTGVGEAANIGGNGYAKVALGLSLALFSNRRLRENAARPPVYYRPQQVGYRRY